MARASDQGQAIKAVRGETLRVLTSPALDGQTWLLVVVVLTVVNLAAFASAPPPGAQPATAVPVALLLRTAALFGIGALLLRRIAGAVPSFTLGPPFWRFSALLLVLLVIHQIGVKLLVAPFAHKVDLANEWLMLVAAGAFWTLVLIRALVWLAALANGAPFGVLGALWRGQRGTTIPIALAFVALVLPVVAVQDALALIGRKVPLDREPLLALMLVDGLVQAVQLALISALAVTAWQRTLRDPLPRG